MSSLRGVCGVQRLLSLVGLVWRYKKPQKQGLTQLLSRVATASIGVGVAVLMIGWSILNGFEESLNERVLGIIPHVTVETFSDQSTDNDRLAQQLGAVEGVSGVAPYIHFPAIVERSGKMKLVQVRAVDAEKEKLVTHIDQFMSPKMELGLVEAAPGIVLGRAIANSLSVTAGDSITLLCATHTTNSASNDSLRRVPLRVTGIITLKGELEQRFALLPIGYVHEKLRPCHATQGFSIRTDDPFSVNRLFSHLVRASEVPIYPRTWEQDYGRMYLDVKMIRGIMLVSMGILMTIASFNLVSMLMFAIKERRYDIAIFRSLGATDRFIHGLFIGYGLLSGLRGIVFGTAAGLVIMSQFAPIIRLIEASLEHPLLAESVYFINFIPIRWKLWDSLWINAGALLLCLLAVQYPARLATAEAPVRLLSGK